MDQQQSKTGWLERRHEKQRLKRERTGDTPEKKAEREPAGESTVKDAADKAGLRGFLIGGV